MRLKILVYPLVLSLFLWGAAPRVSAQTAASPEVLVLIKQLQEQINILRAQIEALRAAQEGVRLAQTDVQATLGLIGGLREGMTGDEVKLLQAALAADSDIYPEGLITGFYGPLTKKAVGKFQQRFGLSPVGTVGPQTAEKIQELLAQNPVALEETAEGARPCAIVPPGHLIAPGWLRKQGGVRPIVPACQTLPPGIAKKLDGLATSTPTSTPGTTPDVTPPIISGLATIGTAANNNIVVTWLTSEPADSAVWYSTSTPATVSPPAMMVYSSTLVLNHSFLLTNLAASSTYYYLAVSRDAAGNTATSTEQTFNTR